jgi:hypothetical protein
MTEQACAPLVDEADLDRDLEEARQQLQHDLHVQLQWLSDGRGHRLSSSGNTFHRLTDLTRTLVTAGLCVHDCAEDSATGGVCLVPNPATGTVRVSWSTHRVMPRDPAVATAYCETYQAMTDALLTVLEADGWNARRQPDDEGLLVSDGVRIDDRGDAE